MSFNNKSHFEIVSRQLSILLIRLGIVLLFYCISRCLFLLFNHHVLCSSVNTFNDWVRIFYGGMRFDLSAIFVINTPFIIFSLLPFWFLQNLNYHKIIKIVFYFIPNIFFFATDYIDMIYSRFTQKRMTFDVFRFLETGDGFIALIPQFLSDFWYVFLIFLLMMTLFIWINSIIKEKIKTINTSPINFYGKRTLLLLLMLIISVIGIRGGFQLRPIGIMTVSHYADPQHYVMVLNTPFSLIKTIDDVTIEPKHYFDKKTLHQIYQPIFIGKDSWISKTDNVVIIIMEGITSEYSKLFNNNLEKTYTPNIDSLAKKGRYIKAFANGTRSMEGVPAILAGIPSLMDNEYMTSSYVDNQITSLPSILKQSGYYSAFFHGGKNGTMNFDAFTTIADFDQYFGKNEYDNDADYDGNWGIFDDPFLQYFANQLDDFKTPFFASIFLLSSHHPYTLPHDYSQLFSVTEPTMKNCVTYSDWAIGEFFSKASQKEWFNNTLFVIISDHASKSEEAYYNSTIGKYEIPMIWFHPTDSLPEIERPFAQQIDVLPSILDYLHISDTVFAFGKSIFRSDNTPTFAINYLNHSYQLITEDEVLVFDGNDLTAIYRPKEDQNLTHNVLQKTPIPTSYLDLLKAFIQTYNQSLIDNQLTIDRYDE